MKTFWNVALVMVIFAVGVVLIAWDGFTPGEMGAIILFILAGVIGHKTGFGKLPKSEDRKLKI